MLSVFYAITGWQVGLTTLAQMLGAAVVPGNSQANMVRTVPFAFVETRAGTAL